MKILITGGAGFIGSAVVRLAIARGHSVVNVDCLTYAANLANLDSVKDSPNYAFERADICDGAAMDGVLTRHKPGAIMHLAAESHVDRSLDGPDAFIKTNVIGTFTLLQSARRYYENLTPDKRQAFRFHHVSTDEVYGDLSADAPAFSERHAYDPSSPYSASKAASDHLVRAWGRSYGLPFVMSNCSNNYGPYQFPEKLIPVVILKALAHQPIPIYGAGDNIRDWLYVDDHAGGLLTVLQKGALGQTYNIGGNNERTNLELVQTLCALIDDKTDDEFSHASLIEFVTDRPGHDRRYAIDASKIEKDLGWTPKIKADEGLSKTLDWYLENRTWWEPLIGDGLRATPSRLGLKGKA
ncbi:MAG: dTDP-glucose 4,6-dehydratase [Robiginitomaculum sp.]